VVDGREDQDEDNAEDDDCRPANVGGSDGYGSELNLKRDVLQ
jgi:hypothetical protein